MKQKVNFHQSNQFKPYTLTVETGEDNYEPELKSIFISNLYLE